MPREEGDRGPTLFPVPLRPLDKTSNLMSPVSSKKLPPKL